ncbi:hypothetical protein GCM10008015_15980 [Flavobacterium palustre]|uniref:Uncharacterized protein n=1 Tax=Flavobacterium palustre TaxID=1476463 RepID=A0ABQ1HGB6_9FLAO|nr:hypothetical protein [Flavobacterium palustre]GGA76194.1 hypothetical protein GCM10008015_15980 [Flavobacterium palustre]
MKSIALLFLLVFIAFLATPTIVKLIEKSTDVAVYYSVSEEEQVKKETKHLVYAITSNLTFKVKKTGLRNLILFEDFSKHDNVIQTIATPPPDSM